MNFFQPEGQPDEYWISRQETEPRRVVPILLWLLGSSRRDEIPSEITRWRVSTAADEKSTNEDKNDNDETVDDEDNGGSEELKNESIRRDTKRARQSSGGPRNGLTLADLVDEEDEDSIDEWSHFYALQMQRQEGLNYHFLAEFLCS